MNDFGTAERLESLIEHLPHQEKVRLVENLRQRVRREGKAQTLEEVDALLVDFDALAATLPTTPMDAAEDIRRLRDERAQRS